MTEVLIKKKTLKYLKTDILTGIKHLSAKLLSIKGNMS